MAVSLWIGKGSHPYYWLLKKGAAISGQAKKGAPGLENNLVPRVGTFPAREVVSQYCTNAKKGMAADLTKVPQPTTDWHSQRNGPWAPFSEDPVGSTHQEILDVAECIYQD